MYVKGHLAAEWARRTTAGGTEKLEGAKDEECGGVALVGDVEKVAALLFAKHDEDNDGVITPLELYDGYLLWNIEEGEKRELKRIEDIEGEDDEEEEEGDHRSVEQRKEEEAEDRRAEAQEARLKWKGLRESVWAAHYDAIRKLLASLCGVA